MKLKRIILCTLCSLSISYMVEVQPVYALRCEIWDAINMKVTPLPTQDDSLEESTTLTQLEQVLQTAASISELVEYIQRLAKLSKNSSSLSASLKRVSVPALENATKGSQTLVDAYKGTVPGVQTSSVDFEKEGQVKEAVSAAAVVSNHKDAVEETAAMERKEAYIQQATIDLLSDILVAKKKLQELKQSDSDSLGSSSSSDTVGVTHVASQMKDFEAQVQTLEMKIKALQNLREGINALKNADPINEKINVGG